MRSYAPSPISLDSYFFIFPGNQVMVKYSMETPSDTRWTNSKEKGVVDEPA
jgi:hypothetical protein